VQQHPTNESLEQIDNGILGETAEEITLHSREAFRTACTALARQAKRKICIFTRDLEGGIYNNDNLVTELKRLASQTPDPSIFILLQNNERVQREGHRMVDLAMRLPSKIMIFRPTGEDYFDTGSLEHRQAFMLVDDTGFVYRKSYARLDGRVEFYNRNRARELANFFQEAWNQSEENIALRRLSI